MIPNLPDPKIRQMELEIANLKAKTQLITTGVGVPSFTPTGRAIYIRQDGGTNTTLYVYEGSAWVAK
jgi:hypothetical protein